MLDTLLGLAPQASHDSANRRDDDDFWYTDNLGHRTTAGVSVSEETAMTFATVWACVNVIAQTISTLPAKVFDRSDPKSRKPVDHPLNEILSTNHEGDALGLTVRETMQLNLELWGVAYAEIITTQRTGELVTLIPIASKSVRPEFDRLGNRIYVIAAMGENTRAIPESRMLVLPGLSFDGQNFLSPIAFNRATIGLGIACTEHGSAFFGNGATLGGVITKAPGIKGLSEPAGQRFIDSINEKSRGPSSAYKWTLLREDMEMEQFDMPTEEAMFLMTRQFQRVDVCGMYRVPLSKIMDLSEGTFNNTEQMNIAWVTDGVTPRCVRNETAFNEKFFAGTKLGLKHNVNALVRGDMKARSEFYASGIVNGWMTRAESRALEELPFIEGSQHLLVPQNMAVIDEGGNVIPVSGEPEPPRQIEGPPEPDDGARTQASVDLVEAFRPAVEDAARRVATKECRAIRRAITKYGEYKNEFAVAGWVSEFYETHAAYVGEVIEPICRSFAAATAVDMSGVASSVAEEYARNGRQSLDGICQQTVVRQGRQEEMASALSGVLLEVFSQAIRGDSNDQSN